MAGPRRCATCGNPYHRCNRYRLWTVRNPGHRTGWQKVDEPQCLNCATEGLTAKVYRLASVSLVQEIAGGRKRKARGTPPPTILKVLAARKRAS